MIFFPHIQYPRNKNHYWLKRWGCEQCSMTWEYAMTLGDKTYAALKVLS